MTALRPLLVKLPCFRSVGSGGDSYSKHAAKPSYDQSASSGPRGPAYPLDDMATDTSRAESQEHIVRSHGLNIRKNTEFEVAYEGTLDHRQRRTDH